ncbi:MAG: 16S rRNA (adenine(1518)-N(6)/adenine(1519)-N(6))-dimethyltransferase RsmA [Oscillospiraceae bacterium]|nr:16S rRNA (adenine(1518)-N(6)/adenine(1519)-N(6))-dimethyltransferase RsmA [Oscillospiraceae bacterium]
MELTDIGTIKELFSRHGFSFTKSLGQNFLINPSVCPRIAQLGLEGAEDPSEICALEIGTGVGVLTRELAARYKKVVAVEIDTGLKPILEETLADFDNVEVIFADVMETDLAGVIADKLGGAETAVCANLPYYITSPVIMRVLESRLPVRSMTVMVQKEAADRLCAAPGTRECGAISYAVRYYSEPRLMFKVSRGSFMPAPNVDSAVIRMDIVRRHDLSDAEEKRLFGLIRAGFSQRRKQLANPLSGELRKSKEELSALFTELGIKPTARAEELTLDDYIRLARKTD